MSGYGMTSEIVVVPKLCPICNSLVKGNRTYCKPECSKEATRRLKKLMYKSPAFRFNVVRGV